jgi:hypothetical protein
LENLVTICRSCHEGVHPHFRNFGGYHPRIAKPISVSITLLFLGLYFAVLGAFMRWSIDSLPYPELTPRNPLPEFLFWGGMLGFIVGLITYGLTRSTHKSAPLIVTQNSTIPKPGQLTVTGIILPVRLNPIVVGSTDTRSAGGPPVRTNLGRSQTPTESQGVDELAESKAE